MAEKLVNIDLTQLKARVLASMPHSADRARIVKGLGAAAMHYWKKLAQQELRSTSRDYIAALELTEDDANGKVTVALNGQLPNMVEQGWDGGDMRPWMLASDKAKQGANGPYLVVPFRHGTPGTGGRNVGAVMPGPIHEAAKKLAPQLTRPGAAVGQHSGQITVHGQRLHPGLPMRQAAKQILERKEKPWHHSSIYLGMIRKAQPTKKGLQTSGYQTFRTISTHTRDEQRHWVHPGITPRNLAAKVGRHIDQLVGSIIEKASK